MKIYRQGDVVISPSKKIDGEKIETLVLAEGEVTGHAHRITQGQAQILKTIAGLIFLKIISDFAILSHEEHENIRLPKGDYAVKIQREFDWFTEEVRNVAD